MAIEKHINFFELQKACEKPGCPLCRITGERAYRYIDDTLYEHVSDIGFRALHRRAGGFCAFHARHLVSSNDGLGVAILSRDILEDRIASFEKKKPWLPKGRCPVCVRRDEIEHGYLGLLASSGGNSSEEQELRVFFTSSDGLCAPHYAKLLFPPKGIKKTVPEWLKNFHEQKFNDLIRRLDRFVELSAYGRREEFNSLSEKDQLVWKEAAICLNGNIE
jgi:hypothetical protein